MEWNTRKRGKPVLALVAAVAVFLALAAGAAAEGTGTLKGSLENTTAGGSSVADLEITLITYKGRTETGTQTARTDREGKFTFSGLATTPDISYLASVQHQGVPYSSDLIAFPANSTELAAEVQIADATASEDVVKMPATHYLLQPDPEGVTVSEIIVVRNSSDKTYVGSKEVHQGAKETLRFVLPAEAQSVEPTTGFLANRAFPQDGALVDTTPVYPGESQRVFRYRIPAQADAANFTTRLTRPADKVNALIPDVGLQVSVSNLPTRSNPDMQGEKFLMFGGQNLAAGTELQFKLEGLSKARPRAAAAPAPAAPSAAPGSLPLIAGGVALALVVAVALVVRSRRGRRGDEFEGDEEYEAEEPEDLEAESEALESERGELVAAIARLDDAFESGKIGSEEYGRRRAEKKRRLVEVVGRQRALVSAGSGR